MDLDPSVILGPTLTALFAGLGVVLRQAWHDRDARQRARRELREATDQVAFIRAWMAASKDAGFEKDADLVAQARQDLNKIYDRVRLETAQAQSTIDDRRSWMFVRVLNALLVLRVRVAQPLGPSDKPWESPASAPATATEPRMQLADAYRKPLGVARLVRPFYWLALGWAALVSALSIQGVPYRDMGLWESVILAVVVTLLLAVLPAASIRALVYYLDERVSARAESGDRPPVTATEPYPGPHPSA